MNENMSEKHILKLSTSKSRSAVKAELKERLTVPSNGFEINTAINDVDKLVEMMLLEEEPGTNEMHFAIISII